jgi:prolyl-tRNA synthetase
MRSREFLMKDAYSFDLDFDSAKASYDRMFVAYLRTFERMGLKAIPMRADTGPIGGDLSHEFIILASTGESEVFCHKDFLEMPIPGEDTDFRDNAGLAKIVKDWTTPYAATSEMHHIFHFGTKYSEPMNAKVMGPDGREHIVFGGSYGIGPTRVVAAAIEAGHDENGIIWPDAIAPFNVGIINMKAGDAACDAASEKIYAALDKAGIDVLLDDTDERAGSKFATADLIGLPLQVIVGPRGIASGEVEIKVRKTGAKENLSVEAAIKRITGAS